MCDIEPWHQLSNTCMVGRVTLGVFLASTNRGTSPARIHLQKPHQKPHQKPLEKKVSTSLNPQTVILLCDTPTPHCEHCGQDSDADPSRFPYPPAAKSLGLKRAPGLKLTLCRLKQLQLPPCLGGNMVDLGKGNLLDLLDKFPKCCSGHNLTWV